MKSLKLFYILFSLLCFSMSYAQSKGETTAQSIEESKDTTPKQNISEEVVTKIIRIKEANGKEKVITQQQVITKRSDLKADPNDQGKINQNTIYSPDQVTVKNISPTSDKKEYTMVPKGKTLIITLTDEKGRKITKAKRLKNGYYLINNGGNDNCIGHMDENNNLILEMFDVQNDSIISISYKPGLF